MYKQILIDAQLKTGNRGQKTELTGRNPLIRRRSALDCRANEEEEKKKEEEEVSQKIIFFDNTLTTVE